MLVSVVIPVYDRPKLAARAVESALAQERVAADEIEIIIVDDGSTPPLELAIRDPRVRIVRQNPNAGAAAARNLGVDSARGKYIAFLDSDDVWLAGKLAPQLAAIEQAEHDEPNVPHSIVCGFYCPSRINSQLQSRLPRSASSVVTFASGCWFMPGTALLVRRATFNSVGPFDSALKRLEDLDWSIRFGMRGGRLHVVPDFGAIVAPSYSASALAVVASATLIEAKYSPTGQTPLEPAAWRRLRAYLALECSAALLQEGRRLKSAARMLESLFRCPRTTISLEDFWVRSDSVPPTVAAIYRQIMETDNRQ